MLRNRITVTAFAVLALLLAACGGTAATTTEAPATTTTAAAATTTAAGETTTTTEAPMEMMDLNIALFPSLDYAAFYVGLGEGIFEKHGLNVDVEHVFTGTGLFS